MRERDALDYLLVAVVTILTAVHVPPVDVLRRETVAVAHETGVAALADLLFDVRVGVVLLALLGVFILLVVTGTVPVRE
jgi:hypothetical protein